MSCYLSNCNYIQSDIKLTLTVTEMSCVTEISLQVTNARRRRRRVPVHTTRPQGGPGRVYMYGIQFGRRRSRDRSSDRAIGR